MAWPSSFAPNTLGYMKDRIADELMRSDLSTQIAAAITDAIAIYQKERFRFNESFTTSFQTIVGQQNYNLFTDPNFPNVISTQQIFHFDYVLITIPPAVFYLTRVNMDELLVLTQTGTQMGQPYYFAYSAGQLALYPIPSSAGPGQISAFSFVGGTGYIPGVYTNNSLTGGSGNSATANIDVVAGVVTAVAMVNTGVNYIVGDVLSSTSIGPGSGFSMTVSGTFTQAAGPYVITIGGHVTYAAPASDTEANNMWMMDIGAERLIRSRAKYQIAQHVTRNAPMAQAMSPEENGRGQLPGATWEAYRELKVENVRISRRGVIRPMYF